MTYRVGYIEAFYDDLEDCFGTPYMYDKVCVEWELSLAVGRPCQLYCYKEKEVPKDKYLWHVGGNSLKTVNDVSELLDSLGVEHTVHLS